MDEIAGGIPDDREPVVAPYGSWASSIDIELVVGVAIGLAEPWIDGDDVYWLETRPTQGGRWTLLRRTPDGHERELTPDPFRVGNRVHEYGGGSYVVDRGRVVVSSLADGRLWRVDAGGVEAATPITPQGAWRFADLRFDPLGNRLYAVRETHDSAEPDRPDLVVNELVVVSLDGSDGAGRVLASGRDFYAAPRPSPDGRRLAWLEWDHPDMPWDATVLRVAEVRDDGSLAEAETVAGGPGISIAQPAWRADGTLHLVSDATGWWNLYACDGPAGLTDPARNITPMEAELADPAWVFDRSSYGFAADGSILAVARSDGRDALVRVLPTADVVRLECPFTEIEGLRVGGSSAVAIAAGPHDAPALVRLDPATGKVSGVLARSLTAPLDAGVLPQALPIKFPSGGGVTARALYYPPTNVAYRGPDGERPPLLVTCHGGPTGAATSALSLDRAFFASRGIAVADVDYRGSSGYGRPYRDALRGQWGIADVEDAVAATRHLVELGLADPDRIVIRGGSAGGYTTLAALAFRPEAFAAGISHYGIADLELIHLDGHKFESRYDEGLLAPWPEGREVFRERSPIHALDGIRAPILVTQGLDDKVVPPSQADAMEAAFAARGLPHVILRFEGEGHGYRKRETRRAVYEAEIAFLGRVLGFTPADVPPMEIPGL